MKTATLLRREIRRGWRLLRLVLHLLTGAASVYCAFALLERLPRDRARRAKQRLARWWSRRLCYIMNVEIRLDGRPAPQPTLFVSNHVSWLDIPCLLAAVDAAFVSKHDVLDWPVIGEMAARTETIFLKRGGRKAASMTAEQMTWRLASRRSVIFFPEGTTTNGASVRLFHARLYQAAIRTHSPVQAMGIRYRGKNGPCGVVPFINDDTLLPHLWTLLGEDYLIAQIKLCDPVLANTDRRTLADRNRAQVCEVLGLEAPKTKRRRYPYRPAAVEDFTTVENLRAEA